MYGKGRPCQWRSVVQVLEALDYPTGRSKWWDLAVLALMAITFRVAFLVMLKVREALSK